MTGLYAPDYVAALAAEVAAVAPDWGLSPETRVRLLTVSENATFRADDPARAAPVVFRVHRVGYHSRAEIASELAWIQALRAEAVVATPAPLPRADGGLIGVLPSGREVVAFAFMPGREPAPEDALEAPFEALGAVAARLHAHARHWQPPTGFARKRWDWATTVGPDAHWGNWRDALGLNADGAARLARLAEALRTRLAAYGTEPERFGLIHADLRLANLLIDGERIAVIDFDDCGFGWRMFDFAAAVSFFETDPRIPALAEAWMRGYRRVALLPAEDAAMIPTMVMLRRLQLTAWIATHRETPTASELGAGYTHGTLALAERYLSG